MMKVPTTFLVVGTFLKENQKNIAQSRIRRNKNEGSYIIEKRLS